MLIMSVLGPCLAQGRQCPKRTWISDAVIAELKIELISVNFIICQATGFAIPSQCTSVTATAGNAALARTSAAANDGMPAGAPLHNTTGSMEVPGEQHNSFSL